ncbi:hypothetical protein HZI73_23495 [Vallitalea pronyensis]|uniref:Uncharacterized protein n=1 Tax=Vallitalea pronyensis TaxID=1348613 RepID=A0A8J8SIX7_9FIRM|nr:hypothetical protein [Vallitalea pronyensis]QUI25076.1 hypothetical protein HZI73_23495 [Vallitalea pronyensis]
MLQILAANTLRKGCNKSYIQQITLEDGITKDFIEYLGEVGHVDYHIQFPRVFFKATMQGHFIMSGALNRRILEVIYLDKDYGTSAKELEDLLANYENKRM